MTARTGWFADVDTELPEGNAWSWQPCLQAEEGVCHSFEVWFRTEEECVAYIRERILSQRMIDEEPPGDTPR